MTNFDRKLFSDPLPICAAIQTRKTGAVCQRRRTLAECNLAPRQKTLLIFPVAKKTFFKRPFSRISAGLMIQISDSYRMVYFLRRKCSRFSGRALTAGWIIITLFTSEPQFLTEEEVWGNSGSAFFHGDAPGGIKCQKLRRITVQAEILSCLLFQHVSGFTPSSGNNFEW